MMVRAILVTLALVTLGVAATAPTAAAQDCVVGASEPGCLVSVQHRVCVTEPCDELDVCVGYGRICPA